MIVTFYSYKGGVGRSMALANVGEWLYRQGLRVIVADWDLEAPGLESYFATEAKARDALVAGRGIMDMLVTYRSAHGTLRMPPVPVEAPPTDSSAPGPASAATRPMSDAEKLELLRSVLPAVSFYLQPLGGPRPAGADSPTDRGAGLWLLSAGARSGEQFAEYAHNVHGFDWTDFYTKYDGAVFFRWLREQLESHADVVLIDSRTGVTEMSGVCTRDLPHLVVSFCAPNEANLAGVMRMTRGFLDPRLLDLRGRRPLRAMVVPSRVDHQSETVEYNHFKARFHAEVMALRALDPEADPQKWWELQIRYVSRYSFHELLVIGKPDENEKLQADLEGLARHVAERFVADAGEEIDSILDRPLGRALRELLARGGLSTELQAEAAFSRLSEEHRARALALLARLVRLGPKEEGYAISPRRLPAASFDPRDRPDLDRLVRVGLLELAPDDDGVECLDLVGNFALEWNRLSISVRQDAAFVIWRQKLGAYLADYRRHPDDPSTLLAGSVLDEAKRYAADRGADLTAEEKAYVVRSDQEANEVRGAAEEAQREVESVRRAATEAQEAHARLVRERRRRSNVGAAAIVAGTMLAGWALVRWDNHRQARRSAQVAAIQAEAEAALARDDYLGAIAKLDAAIALTSTDPLVFVQRGTARVTASRLPDQRHLLGEGIGDLGRAIELDPSIASAYEARASALELRAAPGDAASAISDLTRAIELEPSAELLVRRAGLRAAGSDAAGALVDYSRAIELDPANAQALFNRGRLRVGRGSVDDATADFRAVVSRGGNPALAAAANIELARLGKGRVTATRLRVTFNYTDPADASLVEQLAFSLSKEVDGSRPELRTQATSGDIRFFFPRDQPAAAALKVQAESALAALGTQLSLATIYLDAKRYPSAQPGRLELWLPSISVASNVDVFSCESSGERARTEARTLVARRDPRWRGRWQERPLSREQNAEKGMALRGYVVRFSSAAERTAAIELAALVSRTLGSPEVDTQSSRLDTPGYLSIFLCPDPSPPATK